MGFKRGPDGSIEITKCEGFCQKKSKEKCGEGCRNKNEKVAGDYSAYGQAKELARICNYQDSIQESIKLLTDIEKNN